MMKPERPETLDPVCKPASPSPIIRINGISKSFGKYVAVRRTSLEIFEGEFFALLGASGSGKTTLMRMVAGFEVPSEGTIHLGDQDITRTPPHRRPVNMMFQSYALFPHLDVEANIRFGLVMAGLTENAIRDRVGELLQLVKLEAYGKRKPDQLSGGQRQRVALARAIARQPKVLLLDEPLAALDKRLREETQFELKDLQHRLGITFVVVTHDQEEAMIMADRVAVMNNGEIVQIGSPNEVYETPANRHVATFIGDATMLQGIVLSHDHDRLSVQVLGLPIPLMVGFDMRAIIGQSVWLAIRPEKLVMKPKDSGMPASNAVLGVVSDVGYLGKWSSYKVEVGAGLSVTVAQINDRRRPDRTVVPGNVVVIQFPESELIVLTS